LPKLIILNSQVGKLFVSSNQQAKTTKYKENKKKKEKIKKKKHKTQKSTKHYQRKTVDDFG
jgi:hypothetical protein